MRAFISLTELINQNLGSLFFNMITCLVNHNFVCIKIGEEYQVSTFDMKSADSNTRN